MTLDIKAIIQDPLRLLILFVLLLLVRGLPSLFVYRRTLRWRQRLEMTFILATTMPILVALAEIGERDGVMLPATAAALIGAGVLSVLVYPLIAVALHRSSPLAARARTQRAETGSAVGPPAQQAGESPATDGRPPPQPPSSE
jgi:Kef-type K+ transport system membrane component KefB